jgi:hypothetical protein
VGHVARIEEVTNTHTVLVGNHVGDVGSYWNAGGGVGWV